MKISLRSKVILAFVIVVVPIVCLTVFISQYGISVVRTQVAHSNQNLLKLYANQLERTLEEAGTYLNKLSSGDPDLRSLSVYEMDSPDYILTKYKITTKLNIDNEYYGKVNSFFVLRKNPFDVIEHNRPVTAIKLEQQRNFLQNLLETSSDLQGWHVYKYDGSYSLIKLQKLNDSVYAGSWIYLENLKIPLDLLNLGEAGRAVLLSGSNQIMTDMTGDARRAGGALFPSMEAAGSQEEGPYRIWQDERGNRYMLVSQDLKFAGLQLAVAVMEEDVLAHLPVFQKLIYSLPFVVIVILMIYLLFFRKFLLQPLYALVKGMREASKGNLQVRVESEQQGELDFLIGSFHDMMDKIKTLQIDVYEEKLRTQQAEMKHLQLQIQPHFYLNCLNIIHSLADLQKYGHIQSMAQYLSDYFRFTLHYTESVSVSEEMRHTRNYLEIQRFRYPNRLTYDIMVNEEISEFQLPPLLILPFVENSIKHGMKSDTNFHIHIQAERDNTVQMLMVAVQDNGSGFPDDFLEQWPDTGYDPRHMGLWNVRQRMVVHFGEQSQLSISNQTSGGARVCLMLPILTPPGG